MSPQDDIISDFEKEMGVDFGFENVPEEMEPEVKSEVVKLETESAESKEVSESTEEIKEEIQEPKVEESDDTEVVSEEPKEIQAKGDAKPVVKEEEYVPNFSYSVKGEEKEIPEYLRSAIKDQDTEKEVRDMLTKLDGFDGIKSARDSAITELDQTGNELQSHKKYFDYLNNMVISKDYDNFFKEAKINEDEILKYAEKILDRRELPYQEQQKIQQQNDARVNNYYREQEIANKDNTISEQELRLNQLEIDNVFSRSEVVEAEKELDGRLGKGTFKQVVGEIGNAVYGTDKELTVLQATEQAIKRFGLGQNSIQQPVKIETKQSNVAQKVVVDKNTMPSVGSGSGAESVVSRELTLEDLDRMEQEALGGRQGRK